jgi:selenocysteine lyase/cysteine desulfurase
MTDMETRDGSTTLNRRRFLAGSSLAVAGALVGLPACSDDEVPAATDRATDLSDWQSVRDQFDLDPNYLHFAAPVLASHPLPVRQAIANYRAELDRNTKLFLYGNEFRLEEQVSTAATNYFGPEGTLAFTDSTTMGLGTLYAGLRLSKGEEVLTTEHDFYSTHEGLRRMATRTGARVRKVRLYDDPFLADEGEIVAKLTDAVSSRTRLIALTWVHSSSGVKLPIRAIADALIDLQPKYKKIWLSVDAVHAAGVEDLTPGAIGCDFLVTGCHKWLFGPRGTGVIWGKGKAWRLTSPTIPTFDGRAYGAWLEGRRPKDVPPAAAMTPGGFHSFEHRWALADAFEWHAEIGRVRIKERTQELATKLKQGLAQISGVRLVTPMSAEMSAGIVCFSISDLDPQEVVDTLERRFRIVASVTPYRDRYVRFMTSIVNTPDEIDEALHAIRTFT